MNVHEIGWVKTCYTEKFGVPRQSGLVESAWGEITFCEKYRSADFVRGLDGFSHLWLVFVFHQVIFDPENSVKATVRPPRLGGNEKVGVFASRSPFRPNPIGLSLVKIEGVKTDAERGTVICVSGVDLVNGTPLLDIKPYIPYADSASVVADTSVESGYVSGAPVKLPVIWGDKIEVEKSLKHLISETVATDPRPAYHNDEREYGCIISGINVRWQVVGKAGQQVVKILSCASV